MKLSSRKNIVLENKFVLYFAFFCAIIQTLYFIQKEEITYLMIFLFSSVFISRYNKNMIVIFISAIIIVNLVKIMLSNTNFSSFQEGLDETATSGNTTTTSDSQLNAKNAQDQINTAVDEQTKLLQKLNEMYIELTKKNANLQSSIKTLEIANAKTPDTTAA